MTDYEKMLSDHYGRKNLSEAILHALKCAGKDLNALTIDDLVSFEEFHIGGRVQTLKLGQLAGLGEDMHVVDIGCGIGGPARAMARNFGCTVTGIDATEEYCKAAAMLTERTGWSHKVDIHCGSALDLPIEDHTYDAVWMQHVAMNIEDKERLFNEIARVLRKNGKLALFEIFTGQHPVEHYPLPWAKDPKMSFLMTPENLKALLESLGFVVRSWEDATDECTIWFEKAVKKIDEKGLPPLNLSLLLGSDFVLMARNVVRNLLEGRLTVIRAVFELNSR